MNYIDPVLSFIFKIILAGGGGAAVAYLMIKAFGKGWLDSYFNAKAAKFKADQDIALAELKRVHDAALKEVQSVIDKDLHRARKLYDREFEVLGEAWTLLAKAFDVARSTIATFVPQIDRLTEEERIRLYERNELKHWEIDHIRQFTGQGMMNEYVKIMQRRQLFRARELEQNLARCIVLNGVFMPAGFKQRFDVIDQLINEVLVEFEVRIDHPKLAENTQYMRLTGEGERLLSELETVIHDRIWSAAAERPQTPA